MEEDEATESADSLLRAIARAPSKSPDPERIGRFRITGRLGAGGMGIVYRGEDESLRRPVAIKVLPTDVQGDTERRKRLVREARAAAAVTHPNLAAVYEVGEADGRMYLAMELVEGESLRARLNSAKMPLSAALDIATQIAKGLSRAHRAGIVHRDLKPENVMVSDDGHVKILDFGLAKIRAAEAANESAFAKGETVTHEGRVMGTPAYMAPEQALGLDVTATADVFAFGVLLYEMIAGRRPFAGKTTGEIAIAIDRGPPKATSDDAALDSLLVRCLAPASEGRPVDGAALVTALSGLAPAARVSTTSDDDMVPTIEARTPDAARSVAPRRSRRWLTPLLACGLAIAGVGAWIAARRPPSTAAAAPSALPTAPAPSVTTFMDFPAPATQNALAAAEYKAAMQAFRDDSWKLAETRLQHVVDLDPNIAIAHLRLAMAMWGHKSGLGNGSGPAHAEYTRALALRSQLGERDQAFAAALEPVLQRAHEDWRETMDLLARLHERWPGDLEILAVLVSVIKDPARIKDPTRALSLADEGHRLDPQDGNFLEARGEALWGLERTEEARAAFEQAAAVSTTSTDGLLELVDLDSSEGKCEALERHARRFAERNLAPSYDLLEGIVANGGSDESFEQVLHQMVLGMPPRLAGFTELQWNARLALVHGDLEDAMRLAHKADLELSRDPERSQSLELRGFNFVVMIYGALEKGQFDEASRLARQLLAVSSELEDSDETRGWLPMLRRLAAGHDAQAIAAFEKRRDAEADELLAHGDLTALGIWNLSYAWPAVTREDAVAAVAALARFGPLSTHINFFEDLNAGRVLFLAGRTDEALPYLRRGAASCSRFVQPWVFTEVVVDLGDVLASKGDNTGACAAYGKVLGWLGNGKPKSVRAEKARTARAALKCTD